MSIRHPQTSTTTASADPDIVRGDYLVDEETRQCVPPEPPWTGRVQQTRPDGAMQLITPTGYAWWAAPEHLREATQREREAYDRDRERHLAAVRPVRPSS